MMMLQSIKIKNFKAIVDSKSLKLGALTVFIGNNGAGKSSIIEALETYQNIVRDGLDNAMQRWLGIEHVRHKSKSAKNPNDKYENSISFDIHLGSNRSKVSKLQLQINNDPAANQIFITKEIISHDSHKAEFSNPSGQSDILGARRSLLFSSPEEFPAEAKHIINWQFLSLAPEKMGLPAPQQRTGGGVRLLKDGSNIADFLIDLRRQDQSAYDGIVETMSFILPYAKDLQPSLTTEIERKAWLQLTEAGFKVPGWMLSTGTLRLLALLALLRHPNPPPLIVIEEIENGLDPRSIHLIVEEIRNAVLDGVTQIIFTTHSPYLLNLLTLEHLVLVERDEKGQPCFIRPANNKKLQTWAAEFAPGKLYTMGSLAKGGL
jgi:predicted ATPase